MKIADEIKKNYSDIFNDLPSKGKGNLRFGRSLVNVSSIAGQYYCEKKLEMANEFPLPATERMQEGEAGHEAITTLAEPLTREEAIIEAVAQREEAICIYEFGVAWLHKDVPIIGKVDEAWFRASNLDLVVERKFTNRLQVYSSYHVQAKMYCLGLGEMGFNNDDTQYRIITLKPNCHDCEKLIDRSCPIFDTDKADFSCEVGETKAFLYPFRKEDIVKDLDWALDFWLGKREGIPSKNYAKCRVCEYNSICNSSLMK